MEGPYECSICGRSGVKLWRPIVESKPLICARCAESIQTSRMYPECTWTRIADGYAGIPTGKMRPLPRWYVNFEGKVPSYSGPPPEGVPRIMTDHLLVDPRGIIDNCEEDEVTLIPAIQVEEGYLYNGTNAPDDVYKAWRELPTK